MIGQLVPSALLDNPGGRSGDDYAVGHLPGDHGSCSNDCAPPYPKYAGQDDRVGADPSLVRDLERFRFNFPIVFGTRSDDMIMRLDKHILTDPDIIPYRDA